MCGIVAVFGTVDEPVEAQCRASAGLLRHRGPDDEGVHVRPGVAALAHRRLSIMDPAKGAQPIAGPGGGVVVHNGEIYNWRELRRELEAAGRVLDTHSDSEVIVHLYEEYGDRFVERLDGDFAFAAVHGDDWIAARDPLGVKPLYYGADAGGRLWFASEFKAMPRHLHWYRPFPPGHLYTGRGGLRRYYLPAWLADRACTGDGAGIRQRLTDAVAKRLMSDVPLGSLLSGGLDSSVVTALAARLLRTADPTRRLPTFSVGVDPDAPDLRAARDLAAYLGTDHHEVVFDPDEGVARLGEIIYHLESYDVSLVRGSVPMYFLMRRVHAEGVKVVLAGDGSDEVFGGYLYLYQAPDTAAFDEENVSLLTKIHTTELPTLDKLSMQHSVEARVPFLDTDLLDVAMTVDPRLKQPLLAADGGVGRIEKWLLRDSVDEPVDVPCEPLLPAKLLWRQKEAFEDGVGYSWIDHLKAYAETAVSDADFERAAGRFPHNPPPTKEALLYRRIFDEHFPGPDAAGCVGWWSTRWLADEDPSGRASQVHQQASLTVR